MRPPSGVTTGGNLNDRFGSNRVVLWSLILLTVSFVVLGLVTRLAPSVALFPPLRQLPSGASVSGPSSLHKMARLIVTGPSSQTSVALALKPSTMYLGFSIGSAMGAGALGAGGIWGIAAIAALSEAVAIWVDRKSMPSRNRSFSR